MYQKCLCYLLIFAAILTACDGSQVNPIRSSEIGKRSDTFDTDTR
jgi:hypothetical protein